MYISKIFSGSRALLLTFALFLFLGAIAQNEFPQRPEPPRLVNDFAGILSPEQRNQLEAKLDKFNRETSTQIAIVTVKDLFGYDKGDYSFRLAEKWGIGQKGKNNGILILVKPKRDNETGKVFIAVGYGLEGVVPDIVARKTIVSEEFLPSFKTGDYYTGLEKGTNVLMSLTAGEFTADQYQQKAEKGKGGIAGFGIVLLLFFIFLIFSRGSRKFHNVGAKPGLLEALLLMNMMGGRHNGSWSDFSSGGGSFGGGSSGGGFSGFGGGSFGGGGAGGEW
jgi:uncharacterized protein